MTDDVLKAALDDAQLIVDWVELSGEGPPDAWPTTCKAAVAVARALLTQAERSREREEPVEEVAIAISRYESDMLGRYMWEALGEQEKATTLTWLRLFLPVSVPPRRGEMDNSTAGAGFSREIKRRGFAMDILAYFYGGPGDSLDKAARHIFAEYGGRSIGAGTVMLGHNVGERDVQYDVPEDRAEACRAALKKAGFRLEPTPRSSNET